ncbi:DUF6114 domain-containing protein [Streptomyces sp. RY43-2]|uniref:DUF6114 domain-containing protein n=1 Tax=Streptomyces macrolidinus TaxID=2952607 RepID=A0ABT0Z9Q2_9ACTN|nr:DUF6114 domain-containing protein [Streptomyces macrolidinus]MCN9240177.1 DUF6114 domain-containing protein [Streptomyces macrolidinus]
MSAESPGQNEHYLRVIRRKFRDWRGTRPFWAGLFVLLGGFPIMYFPYANLQFGHLTLAMSTTAGAGSLIIGVLLIVLGISLWFQRHVRTFAGVAAILLALVSIPVSNFGGFLFGFLFALIGGAMAVAWAPGEPEPEAKYERGAKYEPEPEPEPEARPAAVPVESAGDAQGEAPRTAPEEAADGVSEPNDLSETSPANGANGRHSAG